MDMMTVIVNNISIFVNTSFVDLLFFILDTISLLDSVDQRITILIAESTANIINDIVKIFRNITDEITQTK